MQFNTKAAKKKGQIEDVTKAVKEVTLRADNDEDEQILARLFCIVASKQGQVRSVIKEFLDTAENKTPQDLTTDARVRAMTNCMLFILCNVKNQLVVGADNKATTLHEWFRKTIEAAGFNLVNTTPTETKTKKKRGK